MPSGVTLNQMFRIPSPKTSFSGTGKHISGLGLFRNRRQARPLKGGRPLARTSRKGVSLPPDRSPGQAVTQTHSRRWLLCDFHSSCFCCLHFWATRILCRLAAPGRHGLRVISRRPRSISPRSINRSPRSRQFSWTFRMCRSMARTLPMSWLICWVGSIFLFISVYCS